MKKKVLIIDDSAYMRLLIKQTLSAEGYEVVGEADKGEIGIELALELEPDLITLDNVLPDMFGLDLLKVLKEENLKSNVVVISAVGQQTVVDQGMSLGALDYIVKPFTAEKLVSVVNKVAVSS